MLFDSYTKDQMRNITTCYSEHAVKISNSYCSGPSNRASVSSHNHHLIPSIQNAVTCIYKSKLLVSEKQQQFFVRITWCNPIGHGFSVGVADDPRCLSRFSKNSRQLHKVKGTKSFESCNSRIEVLWDLSQANYNHHGPEPISGFHILVFVNSEVIVFLGDSEQSEIKNNHLTDQDSYVPPEFTLLSRSEHFSGNALYSTKAQFSDTGTTHDILIKCAEDIDSKNLVLSVWIDKKNVIQVKRLQWNFRGNQTIFLDGLLVDMMWDIHDWLFNPTPGYAIFMFKTRSGFDGRLWLEEKISQPKEPEKDDLLLGLRNRILVSIRSNPGLS